MNAGVIPPVQSSGSAGTASGASAPSGPVQTGSGQGGGSSSGTSGSPNGVSQQSSLSSSGGASGSSQPSGPLSQGPGASQSTQAVAPAVASPATGSPGGPSTASASAAPGAQLALSPNGISPTSSITASGAQSPASIGQFTPNNLQSANGLSAATSMGVSAITPPLGFQGPGSHAGSDPTNATSPPLLAAAGFQSAAAPSSESSASASGAYSTLPGGVALPADATATGQAPAEGGPATAADQAPSPPTSPVDAVATPGAYSTLPGGVAPPAGAVGAAQTPVVPVGEPAPDAAQAPSSPTLALGAGAPVSPAMPMVPLGFDAYGGLRPLSAASDSIGPLRPSESEKGDLLNQDNMTVEQALQLGVIKEGESPLAPEDELTAINRELDVQFTLQGLQIVKNWVVGELAGQLVALGGSVISDAFATMGSRSLTYKDGFELGEAAANGKFELVIGKYPGNTNYVAATPGTVTLDVPGTSLEKWSPMYNAGFIRGFLENGGNIRMVSSDLTGTYGLEVKQILTIPGQP